MNEVYNPFTGTLDKIGTGGLVPSTFDASGGAFPTVVVGTQGRWYISVAGTLPSPIGAVEVNGQLFYDGTTRSYIPPIGQVSISDEIVLNANDPEIPGKQYQSFANAFAYARPLIALGAVVAVRFAGIWTENLEGANAIPHNCLLIGEGKDVSRIAGRVDWEERGGDWEVVGNQINNCTIDTLALTNDPITGKGKGFVLKNVTVNDTDISGADHFQRTENCDLHGDWSKVNGYRTNQANQNSFNCFFAGYNPYGINIPSNRNIYNPFIKTGTGANQIINGAIYGGKIEGDQPFTIGTTRFVSYGLNINGPISLGATNIELNGGKVEGYNIINPGAGCTFRTTNVVLNSRGGTPNVVLTGGVWINKGATTNKGNTGLTTEDVEENIKELNTKILNILNIPSANIFTWDNADNFNAFKANNGIIEGDGKLKTVYLLNTSTIAPTWFVTLSQGHMDEFRFIALDRSVRAKIFTTVARNALPFDLDGVDLHYDDAIGVSCIQGVDCVRKWTDAGFLNGWNIGGAGALILTGTPYKLQFTGNFFFSKNLGATNRILYIGATNYDPLILRPDKGYIDENTIKGDGLFALPKFTSGLQIVIQEISSQIIPTTGTYKLEFGGNQTSDLAYNASALDIQNALQLLPGLGTATVFDAGGGLIYNMYVYMNDVSFPMSDIVVINNTDATFVVAQTNPGSWLKSYVKSNGTVTGGTFDIDYLGGTPVTFNRNDNPTVVIQPALRTLSGNANLIVGGSFASVNGLCIENVGDFTGIDPWNRNLTGLTGINQQLELTIGSNSTGLLSTTQDFTGDTKTDQSGNGSPSAVITPRWIGQHYIDNSGPTLYHSTGLTNTDRIS